MCTFARRPSQAIALACVLTTVAFAQEPAPVFRVGSDLVVIDLVPLDRDGGFVANLQPSELRVLENGKPRSVQFVRLVRAGSISTIPTTADVTVPAAGVEAAAARPAAAPAGPVRLTIVVDLLTTTPEELPRVKEAIAGVIDGGLPAGAEAMVATLAHNVTIVQPFTADRARLRAAVDGLRGRNADQVTFASIVDMAQRSCAVTGFPPTAQLVAMAKSMIFETRQQFAATMSALGALARGISALPGRKHVILYTRGYPLDATAHAVDMIGAAAASCGGLDPSTVSRSVASELAAVASFDVVQPFRAFADQANRSQVAFYTIDPRGLAVANIQARDSTTAGAVRGGAGQRAAASDVVMPQEFLRVVAADTGGRAFLNSNDLARGLRRASADASEHYLIGYVPDPSRKRGAYHRIEVKTTRPGLSLMFRRGYYEATEAERATADVETALREPGAFAHAGLEAEVSVQASRLRVVAFIPPSGLHFTESDGRHVGGISLHGALRDSAGQLVGGKPLFGRDVALRLTAEQLDGLRASDNVEIPVEVAAPRPGSYRLIVVAREAGGWMGAQVVTLVVP